MAARNPFAPTFGASPPLLAGRDEILEDIAEALDTGPTHPDYTVLFVGARGAGKTTMLNAVEDLARERGWIAISVDATSKGLLARLTTEARRVVDELAEPASRTRITGVQAGGFGLDLDREPTTTPQPELRALLREAGDILATNQTGLLITIDEMQACDLAEARELGAVLQHVTRREGRPVAFAGAALAQIEDTLLSDDAATFLQRCSRVTIDRIPDADVAHAIQEPIRANGGSIEPAALARAVNATSGYAFMIQLVGFHTWKAARDPASGITSGETERGIHDAERKIGRLVIAPTWNGLSDVDRRFLLAMARDDGPSQLATIATRLDCDTNYAGVYRHRLIKAGMITSPQRGRVDYAHHATRDWIRNGSAYSGTAFADE